MSNGSHSNSRITRRRPISDAPLGALYKTRVCFVRFASARRVNPQGARQRHRRDTDMIPTRCRLAFLWYFNALPLIRANLCRSLTGINGSLRIPRQPHRVCRATIWLILSEVPMITHASLPKSHPSKAHAKILNKFGPLPGEALRAMSGYGMNDTEIARYFGVTRSTVKRLRRTLPVASKWAKE